MIPAKGFASQENCVWSKRLRFAAAASLLFAAFGLCTALAQTPTGTPTQTPTQLAATSTPTAMPTLALTLTPNASASPTVTPTRTRTRTKTKTPTPALSATATPAAPGSTLGILPVAGSLPGNFGSFFRTSIQVLNPSSETITGRLVFHPAGTPGQPTDPAVTFTLAPEQVTSYSDLVSGLGLSGLGSIDVQLDQGQTVPIVIARVFDDAGANGTAGFTEPFVKVADVPEQGSGFLIGPSDVARFRYNIGIRTLGSPVTLTATVRDSTGNVLHSVTRNYDANTFVQTSAADFLGFSLGNDQSIEIDFTGGGLIAYGATVDNVTNDPSAQIMPYVTPATPIAERAGPSRGGSSAPLQLALLVAALGVGAGIVIAKR